MTHHTEQCCKECSGWEPALHECSCQCHYATDESAVDWEKTARQIFANELIEQRFTDKFMDFICSLLTSKDAQHKAEVETARKEERERTAGFLKVILSGKENVYLRNDLENLYRDITKETP